ncbi:hypothetical protein B7704_05380 [Streptococcus oralis subsp. dentisani]|nr:hypothetical protein B7704_05380 [Streptococcus oralis subsp. dentisani]
MSYQLHYYQEKVFNTLRKSLQTTSASPYRTQVQLTASFLVCFLIFIDYKHKKTQTNSSEFFMILSFLDSAGLSLS